MTDDEAGLARRKFLERGAVAAGIVWSAPAIRSVRRLGSVGTPPPSSTSSTPPTVTTYTFGGPFDTPLIIDFSDPNCVATGIVHYETVIDGVGSATIDEIICTVSGVGAFDLHGDFSMISSDGTVTGTVIGTFNLGTGALHHDITIIDGTSVFADATGTATLDAIVADLAQVNGTITGTFSVPA